MGHTGLHYSYFCPIPKLNILFLPVLLTSTEPVNSNMRYGLVSGSESTRLPPLRCCCSSGTDSAAPRRWGEGVLTVTVCNNTCLFQSMIQIKERKEMEDAFKKAQKPWSKLLQKVNKAKADYHTACKQEKSASNQERNATGDSSFSMDQVQARTFWLMLILSGVLFNLLVSNQHF